MMTVSQCKWCGRILYDGINGCTICGNEENENDLLAGHKIYVVYELNYEYNHRQLRKVFSSYRKAQKFVNEQEFSDLFLIREEAIL